MSAARTLVAVLAAFVGIALLVPGHVAAFCEIAEPPTPVPTQVNGTQIELLLTEGFARVVIIKEFYNPSDQFKEGQVFFPLEKGHELITDLRLKVGNVVYNSSAQDRGEALDEFLEALQTGQDAALVQYDPPRDVYWIAVTIPPKQSRTTITTLEMPLTEQDGFYVYDYRLSVDARDSTAYLRMHVRVETADLLADVQIPSHPHLSLVRSGDRVAESWVNSSEDAKGSDMRVRFRASGGAVSQLALPNGDRYVRYTIDAADDVFATSLSPRLRSFLIFVDGSGSMGRSGRWPLAADSAVALVDRLAHGETYALGVFRGRSVFSMTNDLSSAGPDAGTQVREFLASISPYGSTNFESVLGRAESWAERARALGQQPLLFLITDGRVTVGPRSLDLENAFEEFSYTRDLPMSGLVIKPSDRGDELAVRNLTHFNHGGFEHVFGDYAPKAVDFMLEDIRLPVLRDVRLSTSGSIELATANPQRVLEGGEFLVLAKTQGTTADPFGAQLAWPGPDGVERSLALTMDGASIPSAPLLQRQWVLTRIHALLDRLRAGEDGAIVDELKLLATANRVVTPYTSLLVTIPREDPAAFNAGDVLPEFGFILPGGFLGGTAPAPSTSASRGIEFFNGPEITPLGHEARQSEAVRRDRSAPLLVDDEVDRWISTDDTAALDAFRRQQLDAQSEYPIAFRGNLFTVFEARGELVGVRDPLLDPSADLGRITASGAWMAIAAILLVAILGVHRHAVRLGRRTEESVEEDPGTEG